MNSRLFETPKMSNEFDIQLRQRVIAQFENNHQTVSWWKLWLPMSLGLAGLVVVMVMTINKQVTPPVKQLVSIEQQIKQLEQEIDRDTGLVEAIEFINL